MRTMRTMPMTFRAWSRHPSPPRFSRWRVLLPEDAGMGFTPGGVAAGPARPGHLDHPVADESCLPGGLGPCNCRCLQ